MANNSRTMRYTTPVIVAIAVTFLLEELSCVSNVKSPAGIYVSEANSKDTLWLYPNGKFRQVVYDSKNVLLYACTSDWSKTTMGIRIDSILMYVDSTYGYGKEYPLEGGQCTGFKVREVGESVVLYWNDFPDIPEKSINYVRIHDLED